ncbi:MAG TPA: dihydrofolate reductase [Lacipirellulaceae bacterium]|jgi:dihydrofolate reductase|nr:dihydrofolate reductase [Lacipirellulaceae bacterium]
MRISIIVAVAENGVIGSGGQLPWKLSADLHRFKRLTMGHTIIMGRRTWESIGRPLPGRNSIVVSRQSNYGVNDATVAVASSIQQAVKIAEDAGDAEVFIVGGAELYRVALPEATRLYYTRVAAKPEGDTFFPEINWSKWKLIESAPHSSDEKNEYTSTFEIYERR